MSDCCGLGSRGGARGRGAGGRGGRGATSAPIGGDTPSPIGGDTSSPIGAAASGPIAGRDMLVTSSSSHQTSTTNATEPRNRIQIHVQGDTFYPSDTTKIMSKILKTKYDRPWTVWTGIPEDVKMMWFQEFKKYFCWDGEDEDEIVRVWRSKSASIVRQSLMDIRRKRCKGLWLGNTVLAALKEKWDNDPHFKESSQRNKKNSAANTNGKVNRGGSISISERVRRCEAKLGRKVSIPEVFENMNYDEKMDKWSSPQTQDLYQKFKKMKEDNLSQGIEIDDSLLFLEATGGLNRQGRSFGFGSEIKRFASGSRSKGKASQSNTTVHDRLDHLENENARLTAEIVELRHLLLKNTGTPNESHSSARPDVDVDDDMDDGYEAHGNDIIKF